MWKCPPSTILVPVDFGDASGRALAVAGVLAARVGARLRALHAEVIDTPPYFTHEQLATIERERAVARARAAEYLRDFARGHGAAQAEPFVTEGSVTSAIIEAARSADLVIMGTHGRTGPSRWWMGSVAERVVHESEAPVLVVRADMGGVAPEGVFERAVVVSPRGLEDEAARVAAGLTQAFGGRVADRLATCRADVAGEREATVMVVAKARGSRGVLAGQPAEQWLRSCTLPMLFVPTAVAAD